MEWKPIETAPKDSNPIWACYKNQQPFVAVWNPYYKKWAIAQIQVGLVDGEWKDIYWEPELEPESLLTHWMPLPEPPTKGAENEESSKR